MTMVFCLDAPFPEEKGRKSILSSRVRRQSFDVGNDLRIMDGFPMHWGIPNKIPPIFGGCDGSGGKLSLHK